MPRCRLKPVNAAMTAPPRLFDRALLRERRRRATAMGAETFLLDRVARDIVNRLQTVKRRFVRALDLGSPGDALHRAIASSGQVDEIVACDFIAHPGEATSRLLVVADEALPFKNEAFDLALSALALQWTNDLPGMLAQISRILKPDGLFLAALIGGDTLSELRECLAAAEAEIEGGASPRVAPFVELRALGSLLQRAGFALPVTDVDRLTVRYKSVLDLMDDLRRMGAANALVERSRAPMRRATLARAAAIYNERFTDPDGRLRTTYDVLWISGWAPHPAQQKPIRPGSAQMRLADALGTREHSTGDKANPRNDS